LSFELEIDRKIITTDALFIKTAAGRKNLDIPSFNHSVIQN
jgi:hypothetical protein